MCTVKNGQEDSKKEKKKWSQMQYIYNVSNLDSMYSAND